MPSAGGFSRARIRPSRSRLPGGTYSRYRRCQKTLPRTTGRSNDKCSLSTTPVVPQRSCPLRDAKKDTPLSFEGRDIPLVNDLFNSKQIENVTTLALGHQRTAQRAGKACAGGSHPARNIQSRTDGMRFRFEEHAIADFGIAIVLQPTKNPSTVEELEDRILPARQEHPGQIGCLPRLPQ